MIQATLAARAIVDRQVVQVIGPARGQTQALCASNWYFDVPYSLPSHERHKFARDMQAILAGLLNRDFATVEIAPYSMIEFARAVEARWPCPQATATRERLEARQRGVTRTRSAGEREREGADGDAANLEFWAKEKERPGRP